MNAAVTMAAIWAIGLALFFVMVHWTPRIPPEPWASGIVWGLLVLAGIAFVVGAAAAS